MAKGVKAGKCLGKARWEDWEGLRRVWEKGEFESCVEDIVESVSLV